MRIPEKNNEPRLVAASWLVSPESPPREGWALFVRDGRIVETGPLRELRQKYSAPLVEFPECAILPGFVNAHTHLELTHFPAWRMRFHAEYHPRYFVDWILQLIKVKRGVTTKDARSSIREGIRMCLESGTTAVGEIVTARPLLPLLQESPLAGRLYLELVGHDPDRFGASLREAVDLAGPVVAGALRAGLSPHAVYTIGEANLPLVADAARSAGLPLAIHCAESAEEMDFVFATTGPLAEQFYPFVGWERYLGPPRRCTPVDLLDRAGLLTETTLAVHGVRLTRTDAEVLRRRGVTVALCPRSNEQLNVGRAPVAMLRKLGIPLALGTDSLASNDSLSLWDELRYALDIFSAALSPDDLFHMVTRGGARALGIADNHGALEAGKRADFQIVGRFGGGGDRLVERIMLRGVVEDVFVAGKRFVLETAET